MSETIEAHRGLIVGKLRHVQAAMTPTSIPPLVSLSISNGLQRGLARNFDTAVVHVGSGTYDDLTLPDDGIAEGHVTLTFGTTLFGDVVTAKAQAADVKIDGMSVNAGTVSMPCQLPVHIAIGTVDVQIALAKSAQPARFRWIRRALAAPRWVKLPILITLALLLFSLPIRFDTAVPLNVVVEADMPREPVPLVTMRQPISEEKALQDHLQMVGLAEYLTVSAAQDGAIYVDGILPAAKLADWREINVWFDTLNSRKTLVQRVRISPLLAQFPAIAAVRFGQIPELIFTDGSRAASGSVVQDGWKIATIVESGFVLERGLETVEIDF